MTLLDMGSEIWKSNTINIWSLGNGVARPEAFAYVDEGGTGELGKELETPSKGVSSFDAIL
jgi:hypothetical protein